MIDTEGEVAVGKAAVTDHEDAASAANAANEPDAALPWAKEAAEFDAANELLAVSPGRADIGILAHRALLRLQSACRAAKRTASTRREALEAGVALKNATSQFENALMEACIDEVVD